MASCMESNCSSKDTRGRLAKSSAEIIWALFFHLGRWRGLGFVPSILESGSGWPGSRRTLTNGWGLGGSLEERVFLRFILEERVRNWMADTVAFDLVVILCVIFMV